MQISTHVGGTWSRIVRISTLCLAASVISVIAAVDVMHHPPSHVELCPDAYLFEFSHEPGKAVEVEAFKAKIMTMKSVQIRQEFRLLLNGFSAQVEDQDELREIMSWPELQRVSPLTIVSLPEQVQSTRNPIVTSALSMTGATRVHSQLGLKGNGIKVGVIGKGAVLIATDSTFLCNGGVSNSTTLQLFNWHPNVVDSGVDFNHPALGGCFGQGCKIAFGFDFVGDAFTGKNTPSPSDTPMDCAGHGSHVAGIIAASDDVVLGVAPNVTLGAYRVLGCKGSSNDDIILAALELAVVDKMDIINLSIGEPGGWPLNPVARAISKLKDMGIMVTASQGNENFQGLFSTNYIGEGPSVLAVASVINTGVLLSYFTTPLNPHDPICVDDTFFTLHETVYIKSNLPGLNTTLSIVAPINGTQFAFGCDPYQPDLTGKVVVVLRGACLFSIKAQHALDKGAAGILFVNNVVGPMMATIDSVVIPSGSMSLQQGEKLFNTLGAYSTTGAESWPGWSNEATATFSAAPVAFSNQAGGSMSVFSSFGLDNELHIKPDIGAPGENIFSTWPLRNGSYTNLSGTSMASPHVAGALALALERFRRMTGSNNPPSWSQIQRIYEIFKNTAKPTQVFKNHLPFDFLGGAALLAPEEIQELEPDPSEVTHGSKLIDSVAKQGAGMINIYQALTSLPFGLGLRTKEERVPMIRSTFVSPSSLELNDTEFSFILRRRASRTITIFNYGNRPVRYRLYHLPAESLHEFSIETRAVKIKNQGLFNVTFPPEKDKNDVMFANAPDTNAKVEFSSRWVTVPAGGQRRVALRIQPPRRPPREEHWVYSGYIVIRAVSNPDYHAISETDDMVGDDYDYDPSHSEAIHVPYAGVKGRMKTLPIFLRPTPTELQVNNQTALCQVLAGSVFNNTELAYSFVEKDVPTLRFCIANPTRLLILDLITSRVGGIDMRNSPTNEQPDEIENVDYQVIGKIASNEFVHRSLFSRIVSTVTWDGTLDLMEGHDSNNTTPVGSRLLIHQTPIVDLMEPPESQRKEEAPDTGNPWLQVVKRDEGTHREDERQGDSSPRSSASSPKTKGFRNHHLLKANSTNDTMSGNQFQVPNGLYRLRLRALRILGNMDNPEDYDVWITPNFTIRRFGNPMPVETPPPTGTGTIAVGPTTVP